MARRTRRTRCLTRRNRKCKRYVRSRGKKNTHRKKKGTRSRKKSRRGRRRNKRRTRTRTRKRTRKRTRQRRRQRGGMMQLSPSAFPPGGPHTPGGTTNGLGKGFYYKNNTNPYLPDPLNLNNGVKNRVVQRGGRGFALENIPGATDLQQTYWQLGNGVKNAYQSWIGGKHYPSPSPSVQPIGNPTESTGLSGGDDNIPQTYLAAQDLASEYTTN